MKCVINVDTGERQRATTNPAGGFSFKLKPGKYRVEIALLQGEALVKKPGVIELNRSDVDAHADFVIGVSHLPPRFPAPTTASVHPSPDFGWAVDSRRLSNYELRTPNLERFVGPPRHARPSLMPGSKDRAYAHNHPAARRSTRSFLVLSS